MLHSFLKSPKIANNLTQTRNPGTLFKMSLLQIKACNFMRNDFLLRYRPTTFQEVETFNFTRVRYFTSIFQIYYTDFKKLTIDF